MPVNSWKRSLWALWFANFMAATGMMAILPFITFFVRELGVTDDAAGHSWAGILVGAAPLSAAVMGPVWGGIADRFGRKAMVIRALLGVVVFVGLMTWVRTPWGMLLLRTLQGVFSGFVPPSLTLASLQAPPGRVGYVTSRIQSAVPAGAVAGFFLGGFVLEHGSMRSIFPICSALSALAVVVVLLWVRDTETPRAPSGKAFRDIARGVHADYGYVLGLTLLARFLVLAVLARTGTALLDPNFTRYVEDLGGTKERSGQILAGEAFMHLLFMPLWGRFSDGFGHRRTFALCASGVALALVGQAAASSLEVLLASRLVHGLFLCGIIPAAYGLAARVSAPERRGSAIGVTFQCLALAQAVGNVAGGEVLNALGFESLMRSLAALLLGLASLALLESWRARRATGQKTGLAHPLATPDAARPSEVASQTPAATDT